MADRGSLVRRAAEALKRRALQPDGVVQRLSDRIAYPQLYEHYRKNFLTHGMDFLRGEDELPLFSPDVWHAPIKWRPIPGPTTASLSKVSLVTTEAGTAMLRGTYGGSRGEVALLAGASSANATPVGAGACGLASTGHWKLDLAQHHWLELKLRTGGRDFELALQSDGQWEGSAQLWRAAIPHTLHDARAEGSDGNGTSPGEGGAAGATGSGAARGAGRGAHPGAGQHPRARRHPGDRRARPRGRWRGPGRRRELARSQLFAARGAAVVQRAAGGSGPRGR